MTQKSGEKDGGDNEETNFFSLNVVPMIAKKGTEPMKFKLLGSSIKTKESQSILISEQFHPDFAISNLIKKKNLIALQ